MGGILPMSKTELDSYTIIQNFLSKELTSCKAASILGISDRKLRKLKFRFKTQGTPGIISKHRGKVSNRQKPHEHIDYANVSKFLFN